MRRGVRILHTSRSDLAWCGRLTIESPKSFFADVLGERPRLSREAWGGFPGGHMHSRRTARALVAGLLALSVSVGGAQAAGAKTIEPLNRYVVSGKLNTDELARAGFDLNEGRRPD